MDELECIEAMWRTGRSVGRTIYAMLGLIPDDSDELIGVMDTPALAREAVECHNRRLKLENQIIYKEPLDLEYHGPACGCNTCLDK
jgi:hypothetical protein